MEGSIINEPLFELKNQFKIVENLAKKGELPSDGVPPITWFS